MTLYIRKATKKDAEGLAHLAHRTFETAFGSQNDPEDIRVYLDHNFSTAQIQNELAAPNTFFLLAYLGRFLIGYVKLAAGASPASPDDVGNEKSIQLCRIYIDAHLTGKGYGSQIMTACLKESRRLGYETVWLGVWEKNLSAQKFYERFGFRRVGTQSFVLGSDVQKDAVFACALKNAPF